MSEKEFVREMNRIVRESGSVEDAIGSAQALFAAEFGETRMFVRPAHGSSIFGEWALLDFLESRRFPFRGVYTAPLGADLILVACIGSWGTRIERLHAMVELAAVRLTTVIEKTPALAASRSEAA